VIDIFLDRFSPSSWSGSRAAILRTRLGFLDQLNSAEDTALQDLIAEAKSRFSIAVNNEEAREELEQRSQTGSFE
jgi:Holliday junction resolvasome RuvABC ATP-dependent DNA helicase subunit